MTKTGKFIFTDPLEEKITFEKVSRNLASIFYDELQYFRTTEGIKLDIYERFS